MDRQAAAKIIRDTFEKPFDKGRFINFSKNLVNYLDDSRNFAYRGNIIPDAYKQYIYTLERIGKYQDTDSNKIDILIVQLKKEHSLERARTMQRNFIAWYLNGSRDFKDAALVAFVSPDSEDWRFSLVKMDYILEETPGGKTKVKTELTPARRWSFLVGENESSHTAQSQLVDILADDKNNPALSTLENAFNIEVATKEFFNRYRDLFHKVNEDLYKLVVRDKTISQEFYDKGVDTVNFSKKLLGQIVFLYFLQKKGWFGVERDKEWGTGPKNFLRLLFEKKIIHYQNFFNDILESLFYEALALERTNDFYSRFNCRIPFLNGGLFDPVNNYDWVHTDILLSNELFSNSEKTKEEDVGTGILDVFDRYNFTVKEDEPLEKEVAVDPEMLGKIFEKLCGVNNDNFAEWSRAIKSKQKSIETKFNKKYGIYYTPREIVHYMCQESLINYLSPELEGNVDRDEISTFIHCGEATTENDLTVAKKLVDIRQGKIKHSDYKLKLPPAVSSNARMIDDKLQMMRICDPAVGSGAFPVGMMHEIVKARRVLNSSLGDTSERSAYRFKHDCIQNCIYGVDIDPGAVEIAKLRLWLSLVVDEDDIRNIKPLPNLDYKIMQGNSLLEEFEGIKLFDDKLITTDFLDDSKYIDQAKKRINELQREYIQLHSEERLTATKKLQLEAELKTQENLLKKLVKPKETEDAGLFDILSESRKKADELRQCQHDFFGATQKNQKDNLKKRIETLEWNLIETTLKEHGKIIELSRIEQYKKANTRPFFLWKLHFSEVFHGEGGFDVVIANPPYVRQEQIKELKPALQKYFSCYTGVADIYVYFYERGFQLLREGGILSYISSNKYFRSGYGRQLRQFLGSKATIHQVIDFGDAPVFDAIAYPSIIILSKQPPNHNQTRALNWKVGLPIEEFDSMFQSKSFMIAQKELTSDGWRLESPAVLRLLEKLRKAGKPLAEYVNGRFYRGILTGLNEAFVVDGATRDRLIAEHPSSAEILKPFLRGRDVKRWRINFDDQYLIKIESSENKQHPWSGKPEKEAESIFARTYPAIHARLEGFREQLLKRDDQGKYFWELRSCAYWQEFQKPKVLYQEIATYQCFAFDESSTLASKTTFFIPAKDLALIALLNSSVVWWFLRNTCTSIRGGALTMQAIYISQIPIPKTSNPQLLETLVTQILVITKTEDYLSNPTKQAKVKEYERQIDQMVYQLYDLTPEDIAVVERINTE